MFNTGDHVVCVNIDQVKKKDEHSRFNLDRIELGGRYVINRQVTYNVGVSVDVVTLVGIPYYLYSTSRFELLTEHRRKKILKLLKNS